MESFDAVRKDSAGEIIDTTAWSVSDDNIPTPRCSQAVQDFGDIPTELAKCKVLTQHMRSALTHSESIIARMDP